MNDPRSEKGEEILPPADGPPPKLEFKEIVYGWMRHVHGEIESLLELMAELPVGVPELEAIRRRTTHIHETFEEALRDMDLHIPDGPRQRAVARAASRREAMAAHPLPPFPSEEDEQELI